VNKDIFIWAMTAYEARTGLIAFRKEISDHVNSKEPLPLDVIVNMLPIGAKNAQDFVDRGPLKITATQTDGVVQFENTAPDDLYLILNDLAMKEYTVTIPADWRGSVSVIGNIIKIQFDPPIQMDVPRIDELGISRSEYQALDRIESDLRVVLSHLVDVILSDLETIIQVTYDPDAQGELPPDGNDVTKFRPFNASKFACGQGPPDPNDPNNPDPDDDGYYVLRKRVGGQSYVQYGNSIVGGTVGFDVVYGPDTFGACNAWLNANCPDLICPPP
jgi:hypothetical protein